MDPDETLKQIRATVDRVLAGPAELWSADLDEQQVRLMLVTLAGDVRDLDNWLSFRGFLPIAWDRARQR